MSEHAVDISPSRSQPDLPLQGWRVVVTRSEEQADSLMERLRALGAEPIFYPTITFALPEDTSPLDESLRRLLTGGYDWLVLTSVNAVKTVEERMHALNEPPTAIASCCKVAAVGPTTADACKELLGADIAVMPGKFVAEALAEAMGDMHGQRVLLANADIARPTLQEHLEAAGADLDRVVAYCTVPAQGGDDVPTMLANNQIHAITFTSGSTIRYFLNRVGEDAIESIRRAAIVCIGPIAAKTAHDVGLPPTVVADTYTEEGMVDALVAYALQSV